MQKIVLASSSSYRKTLLQKILPEFITATPAIDETRLTGEAPASLAVRLGLEKAQALQQYYPEHLIIGSDQVAACAEHILGKPGDRSHAIQQLLLCSGNQVDFFTSICVLDSYSGQYLSALDQTNVFFRHLNAQQIANYVDREQPFDCAGSFKAEGLGIVLFDKILSEDPNGLIGLPLIKLTQLLERFGVTIL